MIKLYAGSGAHNSISTQTEEADLKINRSKTFATSVNLDVQNSDLNPYDGEYNLNLKFESFNRYYIYLK